MASEIMERSSETTLLVATFFLGNALFGIDTAIVQEVILPGDVTVVHHAPDCVAGIRNLRGHIVTVIDLRVALGLGRTVPGPDTRILIAEWNGEPVGLLVDGMADTVTVDLTALAPPPPNFHGVSGQELRGVIQGGAHLVALLDPDILLRADGGAGSV